jgi:hypothetical protein
MLPNILQHKAAGAISVLCVAGLETRLSKQRRLLVTRDAGYADAFELCRLFDLAINFG